ncbi:ribonuclease HII [Halobacteriales archaeon QS_1_67_19]|nr:MAG: ribonuclease HII [Halobacteriales archaeon QS_1_67_19]
MFGTDEAGKGPVLGSMFAAAVGVAERGVLPDGIDDSKNLPSERREAIAADLRADDRVAVGVAEIPVERIDGDADMNTLTVVAHAEALGTAVTGDGAVSSAAPEAIADAGDTSEARFARRVADRLAADVDVTAEHGADETHAVVGAASIVAKVARDSHVEALAEEYREEYGEAFGDLGSGYPSDPTTREFLERFVAERGRLPDCARRSWSTCEDVLARQEQSGLGEF